MVMRAPQPRDDRTMFFVIGAQKAGMTWLHAYLSDHPEVSMGPVKEYGWFTYLYPRLSDGPALGAAAFRRWLARASILKRSGRSRGAALIGAALGQGDYASLVAGDGRGRAFGDISPQYSILGRAAFAAMAACHPNTRFVFVMRDPVDRLWSQLRMDGRKGRADWQARWDRATHLGRSDYRRTIGSLEAAVPGEDILYLFFEDLFTEGAIRSLCTHLGLTYVAPDFSEKVYEGAPAEADPGLLAAARARLAPVYEYIRDRFGNRVPETWDRAAA